MSGGLTGVARVALASIPALSGALRRSLTNTRPPVSLQKPLKARRRAVEPIRTEPPALENRLQN